MNENLPVRQLHDILFFETLIFFGLSKGTDLKCNIFFSSPEQYALYSNQQYISIVKYMVIDSTTGVAGMRHLVFTKFDLSATYNVKR